MKLRFLHPYKSIKNFKEIDLPDFTILTSINGSGKTHLLRAINEGKIEVFINEVIQKNSIYFDYNSFTVEHLKYDERTKQVINNNRKLIKRQDLTEEKKELDNIQEKIKKSLKEIESKYHSNPHEFTILRLALIDHKIDFLEKIPALEEIKSDLNNKKNIFDEKIIQEIYNHFISLINSFQSDESLIKFYKISKEKETHITKLNIHSFFYSEDYLGAQLKEIFKRYKESKQRYILELIQEKKENGVLNFDEVKKSIQIKFGLPPWEILNNLMTHYFGDKFFFDEHDIPDPKMGSNNYEFRINLRKKSNNQLVDIDELSSGEKTLFALVVSLYNQKRDVNLPSLLLLDEIDASLHPSMIKNILEALQNIFLKEYNKKIILVTHSPSTIALAPEESLFLLNENDGEHNIKKCSKEEALNELTEGFVTLNQEDADLGIAYNLSKNNLPVLFVEGIIDKIILETAWSNIYNEEMPFYIQDTFDASFLGNMFNREEIFKNYSGRIFFALFDFDNKGYNSWNGLKKDLFNIKLENDPSKCLTKKHSSNKAYALLLPVPNNELINQVISPEGRIFESECKLYIELLFYGQSCLSNYFEKNNCCGGGEIIQFKGDKSSFAKYVESNSKSINFDNFKPIFEKIELLREDNKK